MSTVIDSLERAQLRRVPAFQAGDRLKVHFQVIEGTRRRTQVFEGVVIKRQGSGRARRSPCASSPSASASSGRSPVHSPKIERIEVAARGDVRRAKLYYLRGRVGKRARVRERRYIGPEEAVESGLLHQAAPPPEEELAVEGGVDAEGLAAGEVASEASPAEPVPEAPEGGAAPAADAPAAEVPSGEPEPPVSEPAGAPEAPSEGDGEGDGAADDDGGDAGSDAGGLRLARGRLPEGVKLKEKPGGSLLELALIVAVALGLALGIQAFLVKPYRIPSESMEPTLDVGQRVLVNRIGNRFNDPKIGDIVVFHPPTGSTDNRCAARQDAGPGVRDAHAPARRRELHQAGRRRPGGHDLDPGRPRDPERQAPEGELRPGAWGEGTRATSRGPSPFPPVTGS